MSANRPGFSLMELVVSIAVTSIIVGAIASAMVLVSHGLPDGNDPAAGVIQTGRLAGQIVDELWQAVQVFEVSTAAVTFAVADRNGDGSPEVIRYA